MGKEAARSGAGLGAAPGTGWHLPSTAWLVAAGTMGSHGLVAQHEGYLEAIATEAQDLFRDYNIPLDHF